MNVTRGKKIGIAVLAVAILLAGLAVYGNHKVNQVLDRMAQSGLFEMEPGSGDAPGGAGPSSGDGIGEAVSGQQAMNPGGAVTPGVAISETGSDGASPGGAINTNPATGEVILSPEQAQIVTKTERFLGRRVDRRDVLTVGNIVIANFSWSEINYLYSVGSGAGAFHLSKDAHQVRELLLSRLGSGEIATLTSIGNKYGLQCRILDRSWDIDKKRYIN